MTTASHPCAGKAILITGAGYVSGTIIAMDAGRSILATTNQEAPSWP